MPVVAQTADNLSVRTTFCHQATPSVGPISCRIAAPGAILPTGLQVACFLPRSAVKTVYNADVGSQGEQVCGQGKAER